MYNPEELLDRLAQAVQATWAHTDQRRHDPDAFAKLPTQVHKGVTSSATYRIDFEVEQILHREILSRLSWPGLLCTVEEEPVAREALMQAPAFVASDALDGSSLLARGLNHWAVVVALLINHPSPSLCAAVVADSAGKIISAHRDLSGVFDGGGQAIVVPPSPPRTLAGATLAFNSATPAKIRRLEAVLGPAFDQFGAFFPLGGNPAITKVMEGQVDVALGESRGHDFAPAAFIAEQAGAYVRDWDGHPLAYYTALLDDSTKRSWLVAGSAELGEEVCAALRRR